MGMKLITDDNKEIELSDLQSITIEGTQKVLLCMPTMSLCDLSVERVIESFNSFFGVGRWLLTSGKLQLEVKDE